MTLDFLSFKADIGNPVLAAGVGATGDVEFEMLIERGEAVFEFLDDPTREALGFGDRELAEFGSGAGNGAAPER